MIRTQAVKAVLLLPLFLAGCISWGSNQSDPAPAPAPVSSVSSSGNPSALSALPSSGLGPQQLLAGECGMFLWSKTDTSKFIFFTKALSGKGLLKFGEDTLDLTQTAASGDIFGQFNTRQTYTSRQGPAVQLSFEPGDQLIGGQRINEGLITLTDAEGWRTKMPVLGVRACQPE